MVLHEQYRELDLNPAFAAYATAAGFRIYACEGYDPESKGKVEAGVKYVKGAYFGERDRLAHRSLTGVGFLLRPVTIGQVGGQFAHRLTPQVEAVRTVQQAVEDGICQGRLADVVVPVLGG